MRIEELKPVSYTHLVNGANFTDGLDGLATSVTIIIAVFFTMVSIGTGLEPISAAFVGALMGFFLYNVYPARVFMLSLIHIYRFCNVCNYF